MLPMTGTRGGYMHEACNTPPSSSSAHPKMHDTSAEPSPRTISEVHGRIQVAQFSHRKEREPDKLVVLLEKALAGCHSNPHAMSKASHGTVK